MNSKNFLSSFLFSSLLFSVFSISCDSPEAWEMSFQDSATPSMEGIIDLHHDLMFIVIFIVAAVLGVDFCMAKYSPKVDYLGLGFCFCSRPTKEENASWKETNLKESKSVVLRSKDEEYALEISLDWFVNGTSLGRFLGREVRQWLYQNSELVRYFNENLGVGVRTFRGRKGSTWISLELAVQFAQAYNKFFALQISKHIKEYYVRGRERIAQLDVVIANKGKRRRVVLLEEPYVYGYFCNDLTKAGDSLIKVPTKTPRYLTHATSVPNLELGFVIVMEREHIIALRKLLPQVFIRPKNNREHFKCTPEEMATFIVSQCERMNWPYRRKNDDELEKMNGSF